MLLAHVLRLIGESTHSIRHRCCRPDILRCVFDTYSGQADILGVDRWSRMSQEVGVVGTSSQLVYQSDGVDVAATPLDEQDATEIFEHFSCGALGPTLVLRLDDESFADALDAVAQRRYPRAAAQLGEGSGVAFEWLLRELEEHVVAMQPI